MNRTKLKKAEERFFMRYPGGFSDPLMLEIVKKHKVDKMRKLAQDSFSIEQFESPNNIVDSMLNIVSKSSLISIFEKPKFKDMVNILNDSEKERLSRGLKEFLYGNQEFGFLLMCELLSEYKIAKWPLMTVCQVYFNPSVEVFIKPTTAKGIIQYFELDGLKYNPKPTYKFYEAYREQINSMKREVNTALHHDNAAFCGFLMMSLENTEGIDNVDSL